jgi:hypothetical protein
MILDKALQIHEKHMENHIGWPMVKLHAPTLVQKNVGSHWLLIGRHMVMLWRVCAWQKFKLR